MVLNCAKCLVCGDVLVSTHRHDCKVCSCGNLMVDGGNEYVRRGVRDGQESYEECNEEGEFSDAMLN